MILKKDLAAAASDRDLLARVWRNLKYSAVLECPPDLRIVASSGVVRLEGSVSLPAEKTMIEDIARMTEGVAAVENALRIIPASGRHAHYRKLRS